MRADEFYNLAKLYINVYETLRVIRVINMSNNYETIYEQLWLFLKSKIDIYGEEVKISSMEFQYININKNFFRHEENNNYLRQSSECEFYHKLIEIVFSVNDLKYNFLATVPNFIEVKPILLDNTEMYIIKEFENKSNKSNIFKYIHNIIFNNFKEGYSWKLVSLQQNINSPQKCYDATFINHLNETKTFNTNI